MNLPTYEHRSTAKEQSLRFTNKMDTLFVFSVIAYWIQNTNSSNSVILCSTEDSFFSDLLNWLHTICVFISSSVLSEVCQTEQYMHMPVVYLIVSFFLNYFINRTGHDIITEQIKRFFLL